MPEKFIPKDEQQIETWGEGYPTAENYSVSFSCMNQDCGQFAKNILLLYPDWYEAVVGVQELPQGLRKENKPYAVICECPECFEKFWFHGTQLFIDSFDEFFDKTGSKEK